MKQLRVLVVDDDYFFRGILSQALEGLGHHVHQSEDGELAKAAIELHDFDMVLSDIRMAKVSGFELLGWIKQTKSMPVILMTGFSELVETQEGHENGADGFLPKPFKREALNQERAQERAGKS
jgi:DNA-binding NtrC family response regulator